MRTLTHGKYPKAIVPYSKWKVIASELSDREQTDCACMFMDNCSNLLTTLVEEGAKQLTLSSFEISFPAEPVRIRKNHVRNVLHRSGCFS